MEWPGRVRAEPTESKVGRPLTLTLPRSTVGPGQTGRERRPAEMQSLVEGNGQGVRGGLRRGGWL